MKTPCILVASCSDYAAESIIKEILDSDSLPEMTQMIEGIIGYDWHISTKYYTADVLLCKTKERTIGDKEFAQAVEAFIAYFDAEQANSFDLVKAWSPYLEQIEPEIKMLVCDRCTEKHKVPRLEVQTWCIDFGFELIELNPDVETGCSDTEDDFQETTGIKRVIQALHAHTWSNLQLKENPVHHSPYLRQLMQEEFESKQHTAEDNSFHQNSDSLAATTETLTHSKKSQDHSEHSFSNSFENENVKAGSDGKSDIMWTSGDSAGVGNKKLEETGDCVDCKGNATVGDVSESNSNSSTKKQNTKAVQPQSKEQTLDSLLDPSDMALFESLGAEDPDGESFEKLFERFARMKEQASNLPPTERKKYAEQVTVAFWRAMGGDEEEIGNLSDSD